MCVKSLPLCPTLCNPMGYSPPGSPVSGILQARILEWVSMPSFRGYSQPGIEFMSLTSPALAGGFFTTRATWEALSRILLYGYNTSYLFIHSLRDIWIVYNLQLLLINLLLNIPVQIFLKHIFSPLLDKCLGLEFLD